ncbi:MAG: DUF4340 domain-containing protein [Pseudomonadota bacterium]
MNQQKFTLLVAVVVGLGIVSYFGGQSELSSLKETEEAQPLYADLKQQLSTIHKITLQDNNNQVTLEKNDTDWGVVEKNGYTAASNKIRELLANLSSAYLIEKKTAKPENHALLEIDDAQAMQLTLYANADDQAIVQLLVGKVASGGNGQFVRMQGENQVWLTDKSFDLTVNAADWIYDVILDVPANDVKAIQRRQGDTAYSLKVEESKLALEEIPEGKQPGADYLFTAIQGALSDLKALDVKPALTIDWNDAVISEYRVGDEWTYKVSAKDIDSKPFVRVTAEYRGETSEGKEKVKSLSSLKDWAFEVASYKAEGLKRMQAELLEDIPKQEETSQPAEG